jgi:hypothetical protein
VQNAAAAQTIVNGTFAHNITLQAGTLTGTGTIQGTVQNSGGLLLPGNNGLGTLTIKGQYAQGFGGTFGVNLAGLNSHGLLAVQGSGVAVKLNGFLTIGLLNGFSPSLGNTFGVLTCTGCTMSGSLLGLSLPTLASGLDWSVRVVDALGTLQLAVVTDPRPLRLSRPRYCWWDPDLSGWQNGGAGSAGRWFALDPRSRSGSLSGLSPAGARR